MLNNHYKIEICFKRNCKHNCFSSNCRFLTIISKPLGSESSIDEKNVTLSWKKNVLKKLKNYSRNHLYSSKVNITDPRKKQLVQTLNVSEILAELKMQKMIIIKISLNRGMMI